MKKKHFTHDDKTQSSTAYITGTHGLPLLDLYFLSTNLSHDADSQAKLPHQEHGHVVKHEPALKTRSQVPYLLGKDSFHQAKYRAMSAEVERLALEGLLSGFRFLPSRSPKLKEIQKQIISAEEKSIEHKRIFANAQFCR